MTLNQEVYSIEQLENNRANTVFIMCMLTNHKKKLEITSNFNQGTYGKFKYKVFKTQLKTR